MASMTPTVAPVRPVPVETVTPIKPSEAIRLGCLIAPVQLFESTYVDRPLGAACAFGAMALGMVGWGPDNDKFANAAHEQALVLHDSITCSPCPECGAPFGDPLHLNDHHRWSRERIADWLESRGL